MNISAAYLRWLYIRGAIWWWGLGFTAFGMAILLVLLLLWWFEQKFDANAVEVVAKVTGKEMGTVMTGKQGNIPKPVHILAFTFQDTAGGQFEGKANVSAEDWKQAKPGDALPIEYDRTNPASSRLAGHVSTMPPIGFAIGGGFGLLFATCGILIVACLLFRSGQRVRLIQTGLPAVGVVTGVAEDQAINLQHFFASLKAGSLNFGAAKSGAGTYRVAYQFTDPSGATLQGLGPSQPYSLAYRWNPGDAILVLYDPRKPSRNEADLFETRSDELAELQERAEEVADAE